VREGIPYVTVRDIGRGGINFDDSARIARDDFESLEANGCRPLKGDVLFSKDGTVGKVALVPDDREFVVLSSLAILRPTARVLPEYLAHALTAPSVQQQVLGARSGTALRRVVLRSLRPIQIPLPDPDEQRRIVEILEEHLSHLDQAVVEVDASLRRIEVFERSAHQRALRGELVEEDAADGTGQSLVGGLAEVDSSGQQERTWPVPSTWAWVRLGDVFDVFVGATPSRSDASLWGGSVPWVSSGEVAFNRITSTRERITEAAVTSAKRVHPPGTVMLAMIGEGKTRGQAAILDIAAAHNQNCASIRVSETPILPEYVYAFLKERYLETRRGSSGGNQPALSKARIQAIPIPIPPLGTQRRIVEKLEEVTASTGRLRAACSANRTRSDGLRRAILGAAFAGKLTGRPADKELIEELAQA
jgi:type I restriction enzyme S subunit